MLIINSVFPFVSILVMNIMIVRTIHKRPDSKLDMDQDFKSEISNNSNSLASISCTNTDEPSPTKDAAKDMDTTGVKDKDNKKTGIKSPGNRTFQKKKRKGDGGQLAIMLLTVSFAFLILTLPLSVRSVVYALGFFAADSNVEHAQTALVVAITSRLMLVNGAINFWLYSIAGQKFRQDLKDTLFQCKK